MRPRVHPTLLLAGLAAASVVDCSLFSLSGTPLACSNDVACPADQRCTRGYCLDDDADRGEGEGDLVVGEGEGDVVGEGEGDVVGEGEGDVGEGEGEVVCIDADHDGLCDFEDCDDNDAHTLAAEACDGFDNDCDGSVDEDDVCGCVSVDLGGKQALACHEQGTFDEAVAFCAARPGYRQLVLRNAGENTAWIAVDAEVYGSFGAWIGLADRVSEGSFVDDGGDAAAFTDFRGVQPNNFGGDQDCVVAHDDGWSDFKCDNSFHFACERDDASSDGCVDVDGDGFGVGCARGADCDDTRADIAVVRADVVDGDADLASRVTLRCTAPSGLPSDLPVLPTLPTTPDCDDADADHARNCHCVSGPDAILCMERLSHDDAEAGCDEVGGTLFFGGGLAIVATAQGMSRLGLFAETEGSFNDIWIGGSDEALEGHFVDPNNAAIFTQFAPNEPGGGRGENCLKLDGRQMNDVACSATLPSLCKR